MKAAFWFLGFAFFTLAAFADEVPGRLAYLDAIDAILARSPDVAKQAAHIEVIRGTTLSTRLALLPGLALQARQDIRREFGLDESRVGAAASVDFNVFRFGSDISGMRAANREIEAEQIELRNTQIRIESTAVDGLNAWLQSSQETEILSRLTRLRENLLQIAHKRFERGLSPKQEIDKLEIDWENDRAMLRDAETALVRSSARVDELLGHHSIQNEWPWRDRLKAKKLAFAENGENSLNERPDWHAAQMRFSAAQARGSQAWGRLFPSIDLNFSYGYYQANSQGNVIERPEYATSLIFSIPLFDRLANFGEYSAQTNLAKTAELEFERVKRLARKEWEAARGAVSLAIESALARDKTLLVSRNLYNDALKRFERGLIEANNLNVDQQRLLQSEQLAVRGWASAHTTYAGLCFARGYQLRACFNK